MNILKFDKNVTVCTYKGNTNRSKKSKIERNPKKKNSSNIDIGFSLPFLPGKGREVQGELPAGS